MFPSQDWLMKVTVVFVAIRTIMETTETFGSKDEYKSSGMLSWPLRRTIRDWALFPPVSTVLDSIFAYPRYLGLVAVEFACALALLLTTWKRVSPSLILALIVFQVLSRIRNGPYSGEGSDQMHFLVLSAAALYYATSNPLAKTLVVAFVALQAMLAYITAGLVKLRSRQWRGGLAIASVLTTETYGNRFSSRLLKRIPILSPFLCWSTIVFECSFPVLVLLGAKPALFVLGAGVFFHFMIAVSMGFNGFFWAFIGTYPCIWWVATSFQEFIHRYYR